MCERHPQANSTIRMSHNLDQYLTMDRSKPQRSCTLFILISWLFEHSSQGPSLKWALTGLHTYPHTPSLSFPALVSYSLSLSHTFSFSFCISFFVRGHFREKKNTQGPGQKSIGQLCHLPVFSCTTWGRKKNKTITTTTMLVLP